MTSTWPTTWSEWLQHDSHVQHDSHDLDEFNMTHNMIWMSSTWLTCSTRLTWSGWVQIDPQHDLNDFNMTMTHMFNLTHMIWMSHDASRRTCESCRGSCWPSAPFNKFRKCVASSTWLTRLTWVQCVAVCCRVLQCVASSTWLTRLTWVQCVAVCCSVLQCVAVCCSVWQVQHD